MKKRKNTKKRKNIKSKNSLRKTLTVFYAANAVLLGAILLYMGISVSGRYSERNIDGSFPELMYFDDIIGDMPFFADDE